MQYPQASPAVSPAWTTTAFTIDGTVIARNLRRDGDHGRGVGGSLLRHGRGPREGGRLIVESSNSGGPSPAPTN